MRERGQGGWTWVDRARGEARLYCADGKLQMARITDDGRAVVCVYGRFQTGTFELNGKGTGEYQFYRAPSAQEA